MRDSDYLEALRTGYTSNVIESLEVHLDLEIFDAMQYRPSLQGRSRQLLDSTLSKIAYYREKHLRHIPVITARDQSILGTNTVEGYQDLYAKQKQVDAFLSTFVATNK